MKKQFILIIKYPRGSEGVEGLLGQYLQGPRTPQKVKRLGYGFTPDKANAWPFPSAAQAHAKAMIVARHMNWHPRLFEIEEIETPDAKP